MTARQIKFLVIIAVALAIWRIFEIPAVSKAFWDFCTLGLVPGTGHRLSAETVLKGLCLLFAATIMVVFRKEFMASLPKRPVSRTVKSSLTQPEKASERRVIVVLKQGQSNFALRRVRPLLAGLTWLAAWTIQVTYWVERDVRTVSAVIARYAAASERFIYKHIRIVALQIYKAIRIFVKRVVIISITAWKLAEPYCRAFDRWLDKQLHANKTTADMLQVIGTASKTTVDAYRRAQQTTRKFRTSK